MSSYMKMYTGICPGDVPFTLEQCIVNRSLVTNNSNFDHTQSKLLLIVTKLVCVCVSTHACTHACIHMHTHTHTHARMHAHMHACTHTHIHTHTHTHIYECMHIHTEI